MRTTVTASALGLAAALVATSHDAARAQQQPADPDRARTTTPDVDPKADALLRQMSEDLASTRQFQFDAAHVQEVVTEDGQKIQILAQARVAVQRPGKLRSDRIGPVADLTLYYDGKNLAIHGERTNLYASAKAPPRLDDAIEFARDRLGVEAPGADLLYEDVYAGLMEDVVSGAYIDKEPVGDRMCHHLAYRGNETDWQIWIEDGPRALPCRYVITSKKIEGAPQYSVELTNWDVSPDFPAGHFTFTPPRDATKIPFLGQEQRRTKMKEKATEELEQRTRPRSTP